MGIIEKVPTYLEKIPGGGIVVASVESVLNNSRAHSQWYLLFGLACCAIEMMATGASRYDFDRLGMIFRASPRQADLMMVCGTVTHKMGKRVKILYDQMSDPKYVLAMGGCASNGGPFYYDCYSVLKGVDKVIPVDVYIPGCPPRPEALMQGTLKMREVIKNQKIKDFLGDKPMQS